jgi:hypothetical protein
MNKQIDIFDIQAEQESIAIGKSYKPKTMDFGCRKNRNTPIPPIMLVKPRKHCRNRNSRQIDLRKQEQKQVELAMKQELQRLKQPEIIIQL